MLVKLNDLGTDKQSINSDYFINVYMKKHETKYVVLARMIDGTVLNLSEHLSEETALKEYERILHEANKKKD